MAQTVKEKKEAFTQDLDMKITALGLGNLYYNSEVDKILSMRAEQLRGMHPEEAAIHGFQLQQYSLFIQKTINRLKATSRWADTNIKVIIGKIGDQFGDKYTKSEDRYYLVVTSNSSAASLHKIKLDANAQIDELDFIANRVSAISKALYDLQYYKRGKV